MPLRRLPFREVRRRLIAAGWIEVGASGSHVKFAKQSPSGTRTAIVPKHREVAVDGAPLTVAERRWFKSMVQRIAALLALGTNLDELYSAAAEDAFAAGELGMAR